MTVSVSTQLRISRTNLLVDLAKKNGGKVTPDVLLAAVGGKQKLVLDVLWNARRSGYVNVEQTREGRKIAFWTVTVIGDVPVVVEAAKPAKAAKAPKRQVADPVAAKQNKLIPKTVKRAKVEKTDEQIKAANLEKMKAVTAKLKKKAAAKKKKKTIVVDDVEQTFGTNGEVGTSFTIDGGWDSMDGINVADLIR